MGNRSAAKKLINKAEKEIEVSDKDLKAVAGSVAECVAEVKALGERVEKLESENELLTLKLEDALSKAEDEPKADKPKAGTGKK